MVVRISAPLPDEQLSAMPLVVVVLALTAPAVMALVVMIPEVAVPEV